jgi:phage baseplate assembly protein V
MHDLIRRLWTRLLLSTRPGRVTLVDDTDTTQTVQAVLSAAEVGDAVRLAEYGFTSVPPEGSDCVVLAMGGNPDNGLVIVATGHKASRLTGLQLGDVAIYDNRGQSVLLTGAGMVINAPAGLTVHGPTVFDGTVTANGKRIDDTHHHVPDSRGDTQGPVA